MTTVQTLRTVVRSLVWLAVGCVALTVPWAAAADTAPAAKTRPPLVQKTFASAEDAAKALADAMRAKDSGRRGRSSDPERASC